MGAAEINLMKGMESDGLISVDRREVRILDIRRLSTLSES